MTAWKRRIVDPHWQFRAALIIAAVATFVHALALPLVVSWDGMQYVHLANVLSEPAVIAHWDFYRTPLFPLFLNRAFALGGQQPHAALVVTTLFGLAGILLTGLIVRTVAGAICGAVSVLLLLLYPVLTGYEHMLLSETGTFCLIALLLWSLVCFNARQRPVLAACWIALILTAGYYWRPTLVTLSPIAALCFAAMLTSNPERRLRDRPVIGAALIIAILPWALSYPWQHLTAEHSPNSFRGFVAAGMFKQVLVPLDNPVLAPVRAQYDAAVREDSVNGRLPLDGVTIGHHQILLHKVMDLLAGAGVGRLIRAYPARYCVRVIKSFVYFLGIPDRRVDDENWNFSEAVFRMWPTTDTLDRALGWDASWTQFAPQPYTGAAVIGRWCAHFLPIFTWLVLASSCLSLVWLVASLVRFDAVGITLTAIPFTLLLAHALTLQADDRYAFPVYPIFLANLVVLIRLGTDAILKRDDEDRRHV